MNETPALTGWLAATRHHARGSAVVTSWMALAAFSMYDCPTTRGDTVALTGGVGLIACPTFCNWVLMLTNIMCPVSVTDWPRLSVMGCADAYPFHAAI